MTEEQLREPPLLSEKELAAASTCARYISLTEGCRLCLYHSHCFGIAQAQREADIKWMKKNCYLKAERELPENPVDKKYTITSAKRYVYWKAQADMLKEVDGVSFKAVGKWE